MYRMLADWLKTRRFVKTINQREPNTRYFYISGPIRKNHDGSNNSWR